MIKGAIKYMKDTHCKSCNEGICIPGCPYKVAVDSMKLRVGEKAILVGKDEYRCPNCNKGIRYRYSNCKKCGQRVKW